MDVSSTTPCGEKRATSARGRAKCPGTCPRTWQGLFLAAAALTVIWTVAAGATVVESMDIATLSARSNTIVIGQVEATHTEWQRGRIVTLVDVRVAVPLKGGTNEDSVITVYQYGGRLDGVEQRVAGAARYFVGEDVLLFLDQRPELSNARPLGMSLGKFSIVPTDDGGLWAARDLDGLSFVEIEQTASGKSRIVSASPPKDAASGVLPLGTLVKHVATALKQLGQPVHPSLEQRLGPDFDRAYHFESDLLLPGGVLK